jgi:secreted PhoX family phosphatase
MAKLRMDNDPTTHDDGRRTRRDAVRDGARLVAGASIGAQVVAAMNAPGALADAVRRAARVRAGTIGRSEWSGACYSPDGTWLFVHIQYPGKTYAITGPWERGWL